MLVISGSWHISKNILLLCTFTHSRHVESYHVSNFILAKHRLDVWLKHGQKKCAAALGIFTLQLSSWSPTVYVNKHKSWRVLPAFLGESSTPCFLSSLFHRSQWKIHKSQKWGYPTTKKNTTWNKYIANISQRILIFIESLSENMIHQNLMVYHKLSSWFRCWM